MDGQLATELPICDLAHASGLVATRSCRGTQLNNRACSARFLVPLQRREEASWWCAEDSRVLSQLHYARRVFGPARVTVRDHHDVECNAQSQGFPRRKREQREAPASEIQAAELMR